MDLPVVFDFFGWRVSAHSVFELLAYAAGFRLFLVLRRRGSDPVSEKQRLIVAGAAIFGAALGSKLLHHLNQPSLVAQHWRDPAFWMSGKTIVGGLLGGLLAVEGTKKLYGIRTRTGDLFVFPLCLGLVLGRIGCLLTGVADDTHGLPTALPWGMDAGDGIARHPAPLYEILFVGAFALWLRARRVAAPGRLFQLFLAGYLAFRLGADFLKPGERFGGMTAIQWASLAGVLHAGRLLARTVPSGATHA